MKKVTTILAATILFFTATAFASAPEEATATVKTAFTKDFAKAQNATWRKTENIYFVNFTLNEKNVTVAYDENGEIAGTSRIIKKDELPMGVALQIAKSYSGYEIGNAITEVSANGHTSYYFTANSNKQLLNLKAESDGEISVESKMKK